MKWATLAALIAVLAPPAMADQDTYSIDPNHTFPSYEIGHFGYSFQRGRFNRTAGKITLDIGAKKGSAYVTMDAGSVSTGVPKLDENLQGEDFFDAAKFPQIVFNSSDFVFDGDRVTAANGNLTIRGITRPVSFNLTFFHCAVHPFFKKKACGADMTAHIKRSEFGMTKFLPVLADEVLLRVNVEAMGDS